MRHAFVALAAAALALLGMLAAGELLVRAAGRTPWRPLEVDRDEPTAHEPDPVLGWRARPGSHVFPPRSPGAGPVRMTFHEEGDRAAGDPAPGVSRVLLFVGGSYTQGWAVSDGQSFPALLQERFPTWRVENFGTAAYGTYQSLLVLEERVRLGDPVRAVVYGFIADHERRNVADPLWLKTLSLLSRRGAVDVPYCTIDDEGELVRHPPARHPQWPLHERLATIALLEDAVALRCGRHRFGQGRAVTERLLLELDAVARGAGARLLVALLDAPPRARQHYAEFLDEHGIPVADCADPIPPEDRVEGDGHPGPRAHARYAACIGDALVAQQVAAP